MAYNKASALNLFNSQFSGKTEEKPAETKKPVKKETPKKEIKKEIKKKEVKKPVTPVKKEAEKIAEPDNRNNWVSTTLHISEENVSFMRRLSAFTGQKQTDLFFEIFQKEYEAHKDETEDLNGVLAPREIIVDNRKRTHMFGFRLPKEYMSFLTKYTALYGVKKSVYVDYLISEKRLGMNHKETDTSS